MKLLAIDTSSVYCSACLTENGKLTASLCEKGGQHAASLMPMLDALFVKAGWCPQELGLVAATAGPGSFTGVRIGLAAAKGLALAVPCQAVGVSTLAAAAYPYSGLVAPLLDARAGNVYAAVYHNVQQLLAPGAYTLQELAEFLKKQPYQPLVTGDGLLTLEQELRALLPNALYKPSREGYALGAAALAVSLPPVTPEQLHALYLRKPQAEREYEANL